MTWLMEDGVDEALRAGRYWLRAWQRELPSAAGKRRFEIKSRMTWMQRCVTIAERRAIGKLAAPIPVDPGRKLIVTDWIAVGLCAYVGYHHSSYDAIRLVAWFIMPVFVALYWTRWRAIRLLGQQQALIESLLVNKIMEAPEVQKHDVAIEAVLKRVIPDDCENLGALTGEIVTAVAAGDSFEKLEQDRGISTDEAAHQDLVAVAEFVFKVATFIKTCLDLYELYRMRFRKEPSSQDLIASEDVRKQAETIPHSSEILSEVIAEARRAI